LAAALLTEVVGAYRSGSFAIAREHPWMFLLSGLAGLGVNVFSFVIVKHTSSMTLKTMTMARNGALVLASAVFMGETITTLEAVGYSGLLFFFALYTITKSNEGNLPKPFARGVAEAEKQPLAKDDADDDGSNTSAGSRCRDLC